MVKSARRKRAGVDEIPVVSGRPQLGMILFNVSQSLTHACSSHLPTATETGLNDKILVLPDIRRGKLGTDLLFERRIAGPNTQSIDTQLLPRGQA